MKTLFVSTGGTAGHIFPAVALIEEIYASSTDITILFIGSARKEDRELVEHYNIPFTSLPVKGIMGKSLFQKSIALLLMLYSILLAVLLCLRHKPIACIGFGGYACFPSVIASKILGIPTILHEQNSIPGKANLILAKFVDTVCISFPSSEEYFTNPHIVYTGNPIRKSLLRQHNDTTRKNSKNILVLGGSLGAKKINSLIVEILPEILEKGFSLYHQTGAADFERMSEAYTMLFSQNTSLNKDAVRFHAFIHDMTKAYTWADFSICRSGASTISELLAMNLPAIFIPFPFAIHNHQWYNATTLVDENLALALEEQSLTGTILLNEIIAFSESSNLTRIRSQLVKKEHTEAASNILHILKKYIT